MNGKIRKLRQAKGLRQSDLPGVHRTVVSRIERGAGANPTVATLDAIANALDVSLVSLLPDAQTRPSVGVTPLPTVRRMSLAEFLKEVESYFEGSPNERDPLPKEKWIEWCSWAFMRMLGDQQA